MKIGREAAVAAAKAHKKKRAPEPAGRDGAKRPRVGEPSRAPDTPVVELASSRGSGSGADSRSAPEAAATQGAPGAVPEVLDVAPLSVAPPVPVPEARRIPSPSGSAGLPRAPGHRGSDRGKGAADAAQDPTRRAPSTSSRSSGSRAVPGGGRGASARGSRREFSSGPRGENWEVRALMRGGDSVTRDPTLAFDYFNALALPRDRKDMEGWSNTKVVEQTILGGVQGLYRSLLVRNMACQLGERNALLSEQKKELEGKLAKAEADRTSDLRKAEAKLGQLSSELEGMKIRVKLANDRADIAEGRRVEADDELKRLADKTVRLSDRLKASSESLTTAEMRLAGAEQRVTEAALQLEEAKGEAELRVSAAEELRASAEARVALAEAEAREAIERASRAVADYKESAGFVADVAAAGVDLFFHGFDECRSKVAEAFPSLDLSGIQIDEDESSAEDGGGERVAEAEVAEEPTAEAPVQSADPGAEQPEVPVPLCQPGAPSEQSDPAKGGDAAADPGGKVPEAPALPDQSGDSLEVLEPAGAEATADS